jgi:hypothetical protein
VRSSRPCRGALATQSPRDGTGRVLWSLAKHLEGGIFTICSGVLITMRQQIETIGAIVAGGELMGFGAAPHCTGDQPFIADDTWWRRVDLCQTIDWWKAQRVA